MGGSGMGRTDQTTRIERCAWERGASRRETRQELRGPQQVLAQSSTSSASWAAVPTASSGRSSAEIRPHSSPALGSQSSELFLAFASCRCGTVTVRLGGRHGGLGPEDVMAGRLGAAPRGWQVGRGRFRRGCACCIPTGPPRPATPGMRDQECAAGGQPPGRVWRVSGEGSGRKWAPRAWKSYLLHVGGARPGLPGRRGVGGESSAAPHTCASDGCLGGRAGGRVAEVGCQGAELGGDGWGASLGQRSGQKGSVEGWHRLSPAVEARGWSLSRAAPAIRNSDATRSVTYCSDLLGFDVVRRSVRAAGLASAASSVAHGTRQAEVGKFTATLPVVIMMFFGLISR
jgi:hypothetical protein